MSALDQYSYLFFVCEGKNEEAIVKWLAEADAIDFPKKQYSLDFCRARTKSTRPKYYEQRPNLIMVGRLP